MCRFNKILLAIAITFTLTTCSLVCYAKKKPHLEKVSLFLKWSHQAQFAGYYYADKAGFYEKQKLKVKIHPGIINLSTYAFINKIVRTPRAFGIASADQILVARAHHIPVVAIAAIYQQTPCVIASLKESNITKPIDLIGKKIGLLYGTDNELIYRAILNSVGIDRKQITEVPIQSFDAVQYLQTGSVDAIMAYSINEPLALREMGKSTNVILPAYFGINLYSDTLFTSENNLKYHPALVRKFVQASIQGWQAAIANREQALDYTIEYDQNLHREHEKAMLDASIQFIDPNSTKLGTMTPEMWKALDDLLYKQHFIKKPLNNIGEVFTNEFVE